jgi:hypothetical protein
VAAPTHGTGMPGAHAPVTPPSPPAHTARPIVVGY